MKKVLYLFIFVMCIALPAVASCGGTDEPAPEPEVASGFEISESDLNKDFEAASSSVTIPIKTTLKNSDWTVTSSEPSWCLVAQATGGEKAVLITVRASEEPDVRTAVVTIKGAAKEYKVNVRQLGYGPAILVNKESRSIGSEGGGLDVTITSNIDYTEQIIGGVDWLKKAPASKAFVDYQHAYTVDPNPSYGERIANVTYTGTSHKDVVSTLKVTQRGMSANIADVHVEGDTKVVPTGGKANQAQPGQGIEHCFDGIFGGDPYHSPWGTGTKFPVILEFFFEQKPNLDYFIYYTRSGNGNFGEVDIYVATEANPNYSKVLECDFQMKNDPSKVEFPETQLKVTKVKFEIKTGRGDGVGHYASCDEMEFYYRQEKSLNTKLLTVFKDLSCSELKENVTQAEIDAIPGYFAHLATQLKNGTYDEYEKQFRIQDYDPYSDPAQWAEILMTKRYSNLDNPTGIYVEAGDSVVICVGPTHGKDISLKVCGENVGADGKASPDVYGQTIMLDEGINKVGVSRKGMLFIMHTADPQTEPIRVHFPPNSGKICGYYDKVKHNADGKGNERYEEFIRKCPYKYFFVKGERMMFFFHRAQTYRAVPNDMNSAIGLWDDIVGWQQSLMGIDDVRPSKWNNHMLSISPEEGYMWASDDCMGFVYTYLENILLKTKVQEKKDNAWGPAHEMGHVHQRAINWPGSTESSNNLFSNYVIYKLGKYGSRGKELSHVADARYLNKQPWWSFGTSNNTGEDTEIHMRMNWQLWTYYHRCGYMPDFWQKVFKELREDRIVESNPGEGQIKFARACAKVANQDLTDFFDMWGFWIPTDARVSQYGEWNYVVTQQMIDECKAFMATLPKPKHAFQYIEDRKQTDFDIDGYKVGDVGHFSQFENGGMKITKTITATKSGNTFHIKNGSEAVAFELRQSSETSRLIYFSNFVTMNVPNAIALSGTEKLYAVQADGTRIEIKY